jgi:hypothetical protein
LVALTLLVALSAVSRDVPPALSPALAVLGIVLAVRAWRGAAAERAGLLRSRGPEPTRDTGAAFDRRADPRTEIADEFRHARNWWAAWVVAALAYLFLRVWLR